MNSTIPIVTVFGHVCDQPKRQLLEKDSDAEETDNNGALFKKLDDVLLTEIEDCDEDNKCDTEDFYDLLITKAPYLPGGEGDLIPVEEIPWVDKTLIDHSIAFHRKYFSQVILANTFALMVGFCVKPNSDVILRTGKLHDPELSFQRYLSTIQRIGKFFMLPFDPIKSYHAFDTVRKMHALASKKKDDSGLTPQDLSRGDQWKKEIAEAMRLDLGHIDTSSAPKHLLTWDPPVAVSQFDMATTQFGFIGTMWLFPRVFGIQDRNEELKGVFHVWAIFGRLLGIRDEFNVCIKPDPKLYDKMFRNIVVESLKTMDEAVVTIQVAFMKAFNKRVPFMTYKAMLFFGLQDLEGYTGENLWKLMSWTDKLSLKIMQAWFWAMRSSVIYKYLNHFFMGLWLQFQFWCHLKTSLFWDSR